MERLKLHLHLGTKTPQMRHELIGRRQIILHDRDPHNYHLAYFYIILLPFLQEKMRKMRQVFAEMAATAYTCSGRTKRRRAKALRRLMFLGRFAVSGGLTCGSSR